MSPPSACYRIDVSVASDSAEKRVLCKRLYEDSGLAKQKSQLRTIEGSEDANRRRTARQACLTRRRATQQRENSEEIVLEENAAGGREDGGMGCLKVVFRHARAAPAPSYVLPAYDMMCHTRWRRG